MATPVKQELHLQIRSKLQDETTETLQSVKNILKKIPEEFFSVQERKDMQDLGDLLRVHASSVLAAAQPLTMHGQFCECAVTE